MQALQLTETVRTTTEAPVGAFPWHEIAPVADTKSVCLFSDNDLFRAGCEQVLASTEGLELKVSAGSITRDRALGLIQAAMPDIVIIGTAKLAEDSLAFLTELHDLRPGMGLIVVFGVAPERLMRDLRSVSSRVRSGFACVARDSVASGQHLIQLIEAVTDNRVLLDQGILDRLLAPEGQVNPVTQRLSARETEVLELMASGLTNPGIASVLCLERKTVERHINSIYNKLDDSAEGHPRVNTILAYLRASGRLDTVA